MNMQLAVENLKIEKETHGGKEHLSESEAWDLEPRISVFGVVRRLREQRYCMIQGEL